MHKSIITWVVAGIGSNLLYRVVYTGSCCSITCFIGVLCHNLLLCNVWQQAKARQGAVHTRCCNIRTLCLLWAACRTVQKVGLKVALS